jgi:hypothetical protein
MTPGDVHDIRRDIRYGAAVYGSFLVASVAGDRAS